MMMMEKIRPVGAELLHADGQMDMTKMTLALTILQSRLKINQEISRQEILRQENNSVTYPKMKDK